MVINKYNGVSYGRVFADFDNIYARLSPCFMLETVVGWHHMPVEC